MAEKHKNQNNSRDEDSRSALNNLLLESKLYTQSKDYKDLLDFIVRLRNFAPFNAMLLQIQKPGLSYAASARDWISRFGRWPKEGARPLLILRPFGPVDLVYDVIDTEGNPLPEDVNPFSAHGMIDLSRLINFQKRLMKRNIVWKTIDAGDNRAGSIRIVRRASTEEDTFYQIQINRNHEPPVQFSTLTHELGHLLMGHLGADTNFRVPCRIGLSHAQVELEAESVSYLVCKRNGVVSKAETYLSNYVEQNTTLDNIDINRVLSSVGEIEKLLGLIYT